ncbi:MAG: CHAD domain-containing protein [Bacteroidales bacterium]|nr:CHAD domain-containing protein [Bacteroidales bacterium]
MNTHPESINAVIAAYLLKYLEQFRLNLETAVAEFDPEAIHEYRVSVKRIRAIIRTLNRIYEDPIFPKKIIQPLREMFKAGGTIRDDQVQIGLVENVEIDYEKAFPLIKAFYQKRIDEQRKSFFLKSVDFDFNELNIISDQIESILEPLDGEYLEYNLHRILHESIVNLKKKRYDLDKPENLHSFRTRYKEIGYVAEMIYLSKFSHKIPKSAYNRMKKFGQELGTWHDHFQLWSQTAVIFQESKNTELLREAFEMRKLIIPIHDKLFQEILHLIKRDDSLFVI